MPCCMLPQFSATSHDSNKRALVHASVLVSLPTTGLGDYTTTDHQLGALCTSTSVKLVLGSTGQLPDLRHPVLISMQGCLGGHCLPKHLETAMHHCGGKVHAKGPAQQQGAKAGLHGAVQLPGLEQKLDMALPGVKLFALELAALQGSAQQLVAKVKQQPTQELDKVGLNAGHSSIQG